MGDAHAKLTKGKKELNSEHGITALGIGKRRNPEEDLRKKESFVMATKTASRAETITKNIVTKLWELTSAGDFINGRRRDKAYIQQSDTDLIGLREAPEE